jgi:hypothetical protein
MHFIKLEKAEPPVPRLYSINADRDVTPLNMVEFQAKQTKSNPSTYSFNKCFFKTPVPTNTSNLDHEKHGYDFNSEHSTLL